MTKYLWYVIAFLTVCVVVGYFVIDNAYLQISTLKDKKTSLETDLNGCRDSVAKTNEAQNKATNKIIEIREVIKYKDCEVENDTTEISDICYSTNLPVAVTDILHDN